MAQSQFCKSCRQANDCRKVYHQLGRMKGPSVVPDVVVAFLLPIVVFTVALELSGRLLTDVLAQRYQMPVAFALALVVTTGVMLAVSLILKRRHRNTQCSDR